METLQTIITKLEAKKNTPIYTDMGNGLATELSESARRHALEAAIGLVQHEINLLNIEEMFKTIIPCFS